MSTTSPAEPGLRLTRMWALGQSSTGSAGAWLVRGRGLLVANDTVFPRRHSVGPWHIEATPWVTATQTMARHDFIRAQRWAQRWGLGMDGAQFSRRRDAVAHLAALLASDPITVQHELVEVRS